MVDLVAGIGAAVGSSTLYSLGIALQALDARDAPHEDHLRPALVMGLLRRANWLLGTGLSILGWPLQVVALLLAPLVVVQPALAMGLLVLLVIAERMLGERPGRYEYLAMTAIVLGVAGAALTAPSRHIHHGREALTIALVLSGLGLASLLPYLLRALGRPRAVVTMVGAGLAFGWSGVATKLASDDLAAHHLAIAAAWGASTAIASVVAVLSESSALQSRPAIQVAPVVFVTQTIVPVVLAPLLFGERFGDTPLGGIPLGASLAVLVVGAALLARSPLLTTLLESGAPPNEGERISHASGSTPRPEEPSHAEIRSNPSTEAGDPSASTTSTSPARIGR
jgi:drug/metabolite transporter (DMT)-like permease